MSTKELIELETIVSSLYGPNPNQDVATFCDDQKRYYLTELSSFHFLFTSLEKSTNSHFNFWILDVLNNLVITNYAKFSEEQRALFRQYLDSILKSIIPSINSVPFISNKFSLLVITWLIYDYPENYPSFWNDFVTNLFNTTSQDEKMHKITMLIDLLHTFDDELIKFRHANSNFEAERSSKIKDHMRVNALPGIIKVFAQVLYNEAYIDHKIISKSIKVISEIIDWNLLEIFEELLQIILNTLILKQKYQEDCLEVINAIIKKGMEPNLKIDILMKININSIIDRIIKEKGTSTQSFELLSEGISNIGLFLPEVFEIKKTGLSNNGNCEVNEQSLLFAFKQLNFCLYFTVQILVHPKFEYKTGLEFIDFLSSIISYIKTNPSLIEGNQELLVSFKTTQQTIENSLIIPPQYKIAEDDLSQLEEDDFFSFRKEFSVIYYNFFSIKPLQESILDDIISKTTKLSSSSSSSLYDIEHCLFLIGTIQSGIHSNSLQSNNAIAIKFNEVISLLFNIPFTQTVSDFILISYYETISRVIQFILPNKPAIEIIIKLFLSKKGICSDKLQTGIKIINYFDKFLYKAKSQISSLSSISLIDISASIKQTLQHIINTGNFLIISEYQLLFHCLSIIISLDTNAQTRNKSYEEALKTFIDIFSKYQINNDMFCEIVKCLTHFLKNINGEILDTDLRILFINFFNVFIGNYCTQILPQKQTKSLYGMITILQRIVIILGKDCEQYLAFFFNKQNNFITSEVYEDSLKILQNMINITKKNSIQFISKHFFEFYSFIKEIKLPKDDISDIDKVANAMYSNYMKLVNTIIFEIPEVLFDNNGIDGLSVVELISFMTYVAKEIIDQHTRRSILRSLKMLSSYLNDKLQKLNKENQQSNGIDLNKTIEEILIVMLNGTFNVYPRLKLTNPIDSSSMGEICQIHFYFAGFINLYSGYLLKFLSKDQADAFYQMIIKINPKQIKVPSEIIQVFNVRIITFKFNSIYSKVKYLTEQ